MNVDAIFDSMRAIMEDHSHAMDLDRNDLGRKLCKAATDGVQYCIAREETPDGQRWADLSKAYEEWKSFQFPGNPIAVLHGTMADPREVAGEVSIAGPTEASVTYGKTEQARQEATWFQEGDAHQPPRPFWGFTSESLKESAQILKDRFKQA